MPEQLVLPHVGEEMVPHLELLMEHPGVSGVGTHAWRETETSHRSLECLEAPPQDFLDTLWEGSHGPR